MSQTERVIIEAVLALVLFLVPAFLLHTSPRFAGSLAGFVLGVAAAILMFALLVYPLAKYSALMRGLINRMISMRVLLTFHVYAGVLAAFLAILHTGHKYESLLGIALVAAMLVVVITGFVGRYYFPQTSAELREQESQLALLRSVYNRTSVILPEHRALEPLVANEISAPAMQEVSILSLVEGIADLEYAIGSRTVLKHAFARWIIAHVVSAILMYFLLVLHIAGEVYYGLRWHL